mmetsp:Transcript_117213/g.373353  ORF Transcript_117213/g.373353 Transcript_117213/m.373353 type:complete len:406 (-) Transcript_117213:28-1245(-)
MFVISIRCKRTPKSNCKCLQSCPSGSSTLWPSVAWVGKPPMLQASLPVAREILDSSRTLEAPAAACRTPSGWRPSSSPTRSGPISSRRSSDVWKTPRGTGGDPPKRGCSSEKHSPRTLCVFSLRKSKLDSRRDSTSGSQAMPSNKTWPMPRNTVANRTLSIKGKCRTISAARGVFSCSQGDGLAQTDCSRAKLRSMPAAEHTTDLHAVTPVCPHACRALGVEPHGADARPATDTLLLLPCGRSGVAKGNCDGATAAPTFPRLDLTPAAWRSAGGVESTSIQEPARAEDSRWGACTPDVFNDSAAWSSSPKDNKLKSLLICEPTTDATLAATRSTRADFWRRSMFCPIWISSRRACFNSAATSADKSVPSSTVVGVCVMSPPDLLSGAVFCVVHEWLLLPGARFSF